jgi:hypothetical protein
MGSGPKVRVPRWVHVLKVVLAFSLVFGTGMSLATVTGATGVGTPTPQTYTNPTATASTPPTTAPTHAPTNTPAAPLPTATTKAVPTSAPTNVPTAAATTVPTTAPTTAATAVPTMAVSPTATTAHPVTSTATVNPTATNPPPAPSRLIEFNGAPFCEGPEGLYEWQVFSQVDQSIDVQVLLNGAQIWRGTLGPKEIIGGRVGTGNQPDSGTLTFVANGKSHGTLSYTVAGNCKPVVTPTPIPVTPAPTPTVPSSCVYNRNDVSGHFIDTMTAVVSNSSKLCSYRITLASYEMPDMSTSNQKYFWHVTFDLAPGESKTLTAKVPSCQYQVDLAFGELKQPPFYGNDLIDAATGGTGMCVEATPTPTPTLTPTPSKTATPTKTATPSPTATVVVTPPSTPTPGQTPTVTMTPGMTPTATVVVTPPPTPTPGQTPTVTATPTNTSTPGPTPTGTVVVTPPPTPTPGSTPTPGATPTPGSTPTLGATPTPPPGSTSTPTVPPPGQAPPAATSTPVPMNTPMPGSTPVPGVTPTTPPSGGIVIVKNTEGGTSPSTVTFTISSYGSVVVSLDGQGNGRSSPVALASNQHYVVCENVPSGYDSYAIEVLGQELTTNGCLRIWLGPGALAQVTFKNVPKPVASSVPTAVPSVAPTPASPTGTTIPKGMPNTGFSYAALSRDAWRIWLALALASLLGLWGMTKYERRFTFA